MTNLYIAATNTDIGKTYTTLALIEVFSSLGYRVGAMKPIETGVDNYPLDATLLLQQIKKYNPAFADTSVDDICPIQFSLPAAPFVAKYDAKIDLTILKKAHNKLADKCDIMLIESAGGLMTPLDDDLFMVDFITLFDAKTLLITDDQLGCINNTLLNIKLLEDRDANFIWCVNQKSPSKNFETISLPYFQAKFEEVLSVQKDIKKIATSLLAL